MSNPMDNEQFRKDQLSKLDEFVKTLYDDAQVISKYSGQSVEDMEMFYMHIHEVIKEMLSCKTTDEFMAMIQQLHQAIAGVLIVIAPANADQVKQDMKDAHTDFKADNFDDLINSIQETAVRKFGQEGAEKAKEMEEKMKEGRSQEDTDELLKTLDLDTIAKQQAEEREARRKAREAKRPRMEETPENEESSSAEGHDPLADEWN